MTCGLCESTDTSLFYRDEKRKWDYFQCHNCELVFRDPETYLPHDEEKKRYQTHNNSMQNQGYVDFLTPVVKTLIPHLKAGSEGLDFGSGPGPILDKLFAEEDLSVKNYDPYFDGNVCSRMYDYVEIYKKEYGIPSHKSMNIWRRHTCIKTFGKIKTKK